MPARFVYAKETRIFHRNGLQVQGPNKLKESSIKLFLNNLVGSFFLLTNTVRNHKCTSLCGQPVQFIIGFPHSTDVTGSVSPSCARMVEDFEELIKETIYDGHEDVELQTICIRMLPCSKCIEILESAIYL